MPGQHGAYGQPAMHGQYGAYGQQPMGQQPMGQQPMGQQPHNPYANAQAALATGNSTIKIAQYAVIGMGALCAIGGLVWLITGAVSGGISMLVSGGIMIAVGLLVMPKFVGMMGSATSMVDGLAAKAQLAQTGIPAMGQLLHVQQTGTMVNYNPEVVATVQVTHPQTGASYQVQTKSVVPQIAIPQIQPGAQVQVRINPHNPMDIALVV
jgi:hypothetical protein